MPDHFLAGVTDTGFRLTFQWVAEIDIELEGFWEEGRSMKESIATYSYCVLSNTQNAITMVIHDVWPKIEGHPTSLPLPEVDWSNNKL